MIAVLKSALLVGLFGYVLPSHGILKRLAESRDSNALVTLKVEGSAAVSPSSAREVAGLLGVEWISGELPLSYSVSMKFPGRCRFELSSPESTKVLAAVSSNGKSRTEGGELPALVAAANQACALLALRGASDGESRASLERHLDGLKINRAVTSLGRFRGVVTYVVGDPGPDAPQFWAYKDRFTPARIRYVDDKQTKWDLHFFDYTSQATMDWFPRVLVVQKGNEPVLRMTALKGDAKARLDDALF